MRAKIVKVDRELPDPDIIEEAGRIIKNGGLVAFPTETVYGLGGNALDPEASEKIYAAKGRPSDNPLIVHIADTNYLAGITESVPENAMLLAGKCWPGPLTMIFNKSKEVPYETTGGLDTVAVRFPSHPVAQKLILASGGYIAAPSANISGRPSPTRAEHVIEDLADRIDMIIDSGESDIGLESTIVDFTSQEPVILRPGFLDSDKISEIIGSIAIDKAIIKPESGLRPKAPGMKYRHYAPKGELLIVEGRSDMVASYINSQTALRKQQGYKTAVLCCDETKNLYNNSLVITMGSLSKEEDIARHLFDVLRRLDTMKAEYIYSEAFYTQRIGSAIMNRLLKAAGHKVIEIKDNGVK